jgi:GNAT superfamily N-acetyltransferase
MRRDLGDGFDLDDDPARVDVESVHRFLAAHTYWALGRTREQMDRLIAASQRLVGLYHEGRQVGFSRTVRCDGAGLTYLADVYVLPELRGRGLGLELVRFSVDQGPFASSRWLLHTDDAHRLYERFGFAASARVLERPAAG